MTRYDSYNDQRLADAEDAEDAAAALQNAIEAEEQSIRDYPGESQGMLPTLFTSSESEKINHLIRKLISQYRYQGEERAQGLQDVSQEILDLCQRVIHEQAVSNIELTRRMS